MPHERWFERDRFVQELQILTDELALFRDGVCDLRRELIGEEGRMAYVLFGPVQDLASDLGWCHRFGKLNCEWGLHIGFMASEPGQTRSLRAWGAVFGLLNRP